MPSLSEGMSIFCAYGWAYREYVQALTFAGDMSCGRGGHVRRCLVRSRLGVATWPGDMLSVRAGDWA
ncbi:hypothetical protein J2X01_000466 [Arthrobacter ginsengisoli]|uniref:Uncharacterized protein n=1 Tax=Arthrobacter ginsengisoli TaxID=1356565 RepID=A0ABU1U7Q7_9MICC|nr:hypothetical protein [Arthrobacter ginsengisoli]